MELYAIRRRSRWANLGELAAASETSRQVGSEMSDRLRWIRSYVLQEDDGRVGTICVYQARDLEAIHEHADRIDAPADEVQPIADTAIINADPRPQAAE